MSSGLGTEQRIVLAVVVRDTSRHWTRADIQRFAWSEPGPGTGSQILPNNPGDKNVGRWGDNKELADINFTRALASLVKRGLLERHLLPSGLLTWKVTQAGIDETSRFMSAAAINDLAKGAA